MKLSLKITVFTLLVTLMIACVCPAISAASADTLVITSEEVTAERGDTVDVALVVTQNPGFAALRIEVKSVEGFEITKVTNGSVKSTMTAADYILWDDSKNTSITGTLVTLTFKISENAPAGKNYINVNLKGCCNDSLDDVPVTIAPIVINVEGAPSEESSSEEISTSPIESDSTGESTTESTTESATESGTESTSESTTESTSESETVTESESATESTTESEPTGESETEANTESAAPSGNLVIDIAEVSAERGEVIKVVLNVVENPGFSGLLITVPEIEGFELQEVTNGTIIDTMTAGLNILWDDNYNSTKTGTLVTLTYKVSDSAPSGDNTVSVKVRLCNNENFEEVHVVIDPIVIKVASDGSGCNGGCSGEIGFGAMIVTTLLAGAFFFRKKR